jgi:hypothetical protein
VKDEKYGGVGTTRTADKPAVDMESGGYTEK